MNIARWLHSTCVIGDFAYVICGEGDVLNQFNSFERLKISNYDSRQRSWELIEISEDIFPERGGHSCVPLNDKEILIFGG